MYSFSFATESVNRKMSLGKWKVESLCFQRLIKKSTIFPGIFFLSSYTGITFDTCYHDISYQPPLGPAVLKPGFDLRVCHLETLCQSCPLGAGQVLLSMETLF